MKKKRPQQQVTPPTKGLNILAIKRSPEQVEPQKEQPAVLAMEKHELEAASAPEPVVPTPVDNSSHIAIASSDEAPVSDAIASSRESASEPVPDSNPSSPASGAFFQAVGIIQADVTSDGDKTFVTIGDKSFGLYYASTHRMAYEALLKEITNTGITQQKLIVYPRIIHYPGGKQPYRLQFQLAGF